MMSMEEYIGMLDTFTIIGLIFGAICGCIIGRSLLYYMLVKSNLFGHEDELDNPYNQLDSKTRWTLGLIGGFFFIFGVIMFVLMLTMVFTPASEDKFVVQTGAFGGIVIGGLVLVPAITGKSES